MSVQVIMKDGRPEWAVLPYEEYERLLKIAEQQGHAVEPEGVKAETVSMPKQSPAPKSGPASSNRAMNQPEPAKSPQHTLESALKGMISEPQGAFDPAKAQALRNAKNLDVAMVARDIGISGQYLQQIESGERQPGEPVVRNIARSLGVEISELMADKQG